MQTTNGNNDTINDQQFMHRGTQCNTLLTTTAQAIWDGQAILATDGSVKDNMATYAWIISNSNDEVKQDIASGGLLPPSAPYAHHASKRPEAAALYATLKWIEHLLNTYPDTTSDASNTPALPIPIDNLSVI